MSSTFTTEEFRRQYAHRDVGGKAIRPSHGRVRGTKKGMNKLEQGYARYLDAHPLVAWWAFEFITLKLAENTRLTMDFAVQLVTGEIVLRDTKATSKATAKRKQRLLIEDDAAVKLRVAATYSPFRIEIATQVNGEWVHKEICPQ